MVNKAGKLFENKLKFMLLNAQLLKGKSSQIFNYILEQRVDIVIITETWLTNKDTLWVQANDLNNNSCVFHHHPHEGWKEGGVAIIHKKCITTDIVSKVDTSTFEFITIRTKNLKRQLTLTGMYHPPYGATPTNITISFNDNLTDFITCLLMDYNNFIMGDFNTHLHDITQNKTIIFRDMMKALGLH